LEAGKEAEEVVVGKGVEVVAEAMVTEAEAKENVAGIMIGAQKPL
jgi:hypothetical protein